VHVVTDKEKDVQLTTEGKFYHPKLASDSQTIGWLIITEYPQDEGGVLKVAEELVIYQDGRVVNTIQPGGFIRDWEFWDNGKQVAIYTGALHFAGSFFVRCRYWKDS
jgi:hypothetical protein